MHASDYRAGFVAIIGKPNAGKSTLMNQLVKEPIAITHAKAQTTRHTLYGIVSEKTFQIIYTDTPGIILPVYPLHTAMMKAVETAQIDADIIIWLADAQDLTLLPLLKAGIANKPIIVVLNKIDLLSADQLNAATTYWADHNPGCEIIAISAIKNINIDQLINKIVEWLPIHPPYYPDKTLTTRPERFFAQEMIREKILDQYQQEIPYSVEVVIEEFKEMEHLIKIQAIIHVERQTQKGIMIGHKGAALKKLGISARAALENFFQKQIFLAQLVKVAPNWRKNILLLKKFGYPTVTPTSSYSLHKASELKKITADKENA